MIHSRGFKREVNVARKKSYPRHLECENLGRMRIVHKRHWYLVNHGKHLSSGVVVVE